MRVHSLRCKLVLGAACAVLAAGATIYSVLFNDSFEGKMSGTFMDERFRENARRAQLAAYRTGFGILLVTVAVLGRGALGGNLEYTLIALLCVLSLTLGLVIFLQEYLLYRYDHDDALPAKDDECGGV